MAETPMTLITQIAPGAANLMTPQRATNARMRMNNKYLRKLPPVQQSDDLYDVYSVLVGFNVSCPARQHAIKKLLCAGLRGKGDALQDLREALQAVERAIELERDQ